MTLDPLKKAHTLV